MRIETHHTTLALTIAGHYAKGLGFSGSMCVRLGEMIIDVPAKMQMIVEGRTLV